MLTNDTIRGHVMRGRGGALSPSFMRKSGVVTANAASVVIFTVTIIGTHSVTVTLSNGGRLITAGRD